MISKLELVDEFRIMLQGKVDDYMTACFPKGAGSPQYTGRELVAVKPGKKYIRIDVGRSGKFMFDTADCHLYFIKGYGVIDKKKDFGSLPVIIQKGFDWDGYSIMPKGMARNYRSRYGYAGKIA